MGRNEADFPSFLLRLPAGEFLQGPPAPRAHFSCPCIARAHGCHVPEGVATAVSSAVRRPCASSGPAGPLPAGSRALRPTRACNRHVHVRPSATRGHERAAQRPPGLGEEGPRGDGGRGAPGRIWAQAPRARAGRGGAWGPGRRTERSRAARLPRAVRPRREPRGGASRPSSRRRRASSAHARQSRAGAPIGRARVTWPRPSRKGGWEAAAVSWKWTRLGSWPRTLRAAAGRRRGGRAGARSPEGGGASRRQVPATLPRALVSARTVTLFYARRRASVQCTERGQTLRHAAKKGAAGAGTSGRLSQRRHGLQGAPGDL